MFMGKGIDLKKTRRGGSQGVKGSRAMIKAAIAVVLLVAIAVAAALFLVRRNVGNNTNSSLASPGVDFKPVVTPKGWTKGNMAAKTVLVEFGDFQCGACAAARETVAAVLKNHERDLRVVFKNFPMESVHRNSLIAAQAAEAAGRQFKFWEMHDLLFNRQREWANVPDAQTFFLTYASELQLDLERFRRDLWDNEIRDKIYRDLLEGQLASVTSVPTFFLNGSRMPQSKSEEQFEKMIVGAIKTAK
jgi:protein-disulfide isomerase